MLQTTMFVCVCVCVCVCVYVCVCVGASKKVLVLAINVTGPAIINHRSAKNCQIVYLCF